MATIGQRAYPAAVHRFFDGLVLGDAERACSVAATDVDFRTPWNEDVRTGREALQELLTTVFADAETRPSFSMRDLRGDGNVITLDVSVSGRFGAAPKAMQLQLLHLQDQIHHVVLE